MLSLKYIFYYIVINKLYPWEGIWDQIIFYRFTSIKLIGNVILKFWDGFINTDVDCPAVEIVWLLVTDFTRPWFRLLQCILSKMEIWIFYIQALVSLFKYFLVCKYILKLSELTMLVDMLACNW